MINQQTIKPIKCMKTTFELLENTKDNIAIKKIYWEIMSEVVIWKILGYLFKLLMFIGT